MKQQTLSGPFDPRQWLAQYAARRPAPPPAPAPAPLPPPPGQRLAVLHAQVGELTQQVFELILKAHEAGLIADPALVGNAAPDDSADCWAEYDGPVQPDLERFAVNVAAGLGQGDAGEWVEW